MKCGKFTLRPNGWLVFCLVAVLCLAVVDFYLYSVRLWDAPPSAGAKFFTCVLESALVFTPFVFLRGKWQWAVLVPLLFFPLLVMANVLHLRSFGDLVPPSLYFTGAAFEPIVIKCGIDLLKGTDIIPALAAAVPVVLYIVRHRRLQAGRLPLSLGLGYLAAVFAGCLLYGAMVCRRVSLWYDAHGWKEISHELFSERPAAYEGYLESRGFGWYLAVAAVDIMNGPDNLTEAERAEIDAFLAERNAGFESLAPLALPDSLRPRNLVFIVVESWSSNLFGTPEGRAAMPNVHALLSDSASVLLANLANDTGLGRSSDGQLVYNTGILPLKTEPIVFRYVGKPFPGLARAFGENSLEVIGESPTVWSHHRTNADYGFKRLVGGIAPESETGDSVIFARAAAEAAALCEPFYLEVTTLSMHAPYTEKAVPDLLPDSVTARLNQAERNYLSRVHFFDRHLGRFIAELKKSGTFDRTLIVLAGDHDIPSDTTEMPSLYSPDVPALILNSPLRPASEGPFRQADLYTSLVDLMNLRIEFFGHPYRGFGESIFREGSRPDDSPRAEKVSETIIRNRL